MLSIFVEIYIVLVLILRPADRMCQGLAQGMCLMGAGRETEMETPSA